MAYMRGSTPLTSPFAWKNGNGGLRVLLWFFSEFFVGELGTLTSPSPSCRHMVPLASPCRNSVRHRCKAVAGEGLPHVAGSPCGYLVAWLLAGEISSALHRSREDAWQQVPYEEFPLGSELDVWLLRDLARRSEEGFLRVVTAPSLACYVPDFRR